jgi:signal transduction histidine kinase
MRIRTQFIITMCLFGIVLVAISASAVITNRQVENNNEQENIAHNIAQGVSELSYLSNDYVIYRESQQLERWQSRFASFSSDVASLQADRPVEQDIIRNIQEDTRRLKDVFDSVVSSGGSSSGNQGEAIDPEVLQVSWSRIAVQSQTLISEASQLSDLQGAQADQLQRTNLFVIIAMIAVLVGYFAVNYLLIQRRTLRSIANLQTGASVIGSGNLDFKIEEKKNDEIGDLSRAFNRMTTSLKTVTASKTELEREVAARKEVEEQLLTVNEELRGKTIELEAEIDERKKAEEALQKYTSELETANKELESFSYSVSHDLRAPLRSMDGYSQALLEDYTDRLDDQGKKWLQNIRTSSQHMGHLIDDILGLSRVIRAELKFEIVNLSEIASVAVEGLKRVAPKRQIEFMIIPGIAVSGDSNLLSLVLQNLLDNAFKFTSASLFARIEFGFKQQADGKVYYVKDNGAGFDMRYVDKLFKPFQRVHSDKEYPGTGIGLATVQRIIQRHGGEVWAEGEINKGATFYFTLNQERK